MTQLWTAQSGTLVRRVYANDTFVLGVTKPRPTDGTVTRRFLQIPLIFTTWLC